MAGSASGIVTLLLVIFIGPIYYALLALYNRLCRRRAANSMEGKRKLDDSASKPSAESSDGREQVGSAGYLLGLLGYAIGIGNLWRFPYLVGKFGGGAFVFAYLVCLFLVAIPLYLLEMTLGQHTRKSTVPCFTSIRPRWRSLGYAQAFMLFCALAYYNVLLAYASVYIAGSLVTPLPWTAEAMAMELFNGTNLSTITALINTTEGDIAALNGSVVYPLQSPASYYWEVNVLNRYANLEGHGLGPVQWKLAVGLLFVWVLVCISLSFGKKVLEQVTWVTVIGPVILVLVLLIQTTQLEGAGDGVRFYIGKFDARKLADMDLWATACGQILFSLSPGCGTAITMSSYTKPDEDIFRVCMIVSLSNSLFSLTGGFAIFSVLGTASNTDRTLSKIQNPLGHGPLLGTSLMAVGSITVLDRQPSPHDWADGCRSRKQERNGPRFQCGLPGPNAAPRQSALIVGGPLCCSLPASPAVACACAYEPSHHVTPLVSPHALVHAHVP